MKQYLLFVFVLFVSSLFTVYCTEDIENPNDINAKYNTSATESNTRGFQNTIKDCVQSCRRLLFRGDRDLNYCIEGCRIRIYRKIYDCVYEQCNDRGNGIPLKFSREQYHQCVYLCKIKPKLRSKPSKATQTTTTIPRLMTSTAIPSTVHFPTHSSRMPFIPLEYHYFSDKKRKSFKEVIPKLNSINE